MQTNEDIVARFFMALNALYAMNKIRFFADFERKVGISHAQLAICQHYIDLSECITGYDDYYSLEEALRIAQNIDQEQICKRDGKILI